MARTTLFSWVPRLPKRARIATAMARIEKDQFRLGHRHRRRRLLPTSTLGRRQCAARAIKHAHAGQNGEQMAATKIGHGERQGSKRMNINSILLNQ